MENSTIFSYERWLPQTPELKQKFLAARPFPHLVFEDFLQADAAEQLLKEFPGAAQAAWNYYANYNTKKLGINNPDHFGAVTKSIFRQLHSEAFLGFLGALTGIEGLFPDEKFEGGGLHQIERGGYLNIHADFTVHPHRRDWKRRLNIIIYLNKNWKDEYGGQLQLWDTSMRQCVVSVAPHFNRAVLFMTNADAYHGHPDPLMCPEGESRKSLALYYYTEERAPEIRSTNFRARPEDSAAKAAGIYIDKKLARAYDTVKRAFSLDDRFVSKFLRFFYRRKK